MEIEIDVAEHFGRLAVEGVLAGTVIVRFGNPIETMHVNVLFKDQGDRVANEAAAISAAKQLAFRFTR